MQPFDIQLSPNTTCNLTIITLSSGKRSTPTTFEFTSGMYKISYSKTSVVVNEKRAGRSSSVLVFTVATYVYPPIARKRSKHYNELT